MGSSRDRGKNGFDVFAQVVGLVGRSFGDQRLQLGDDSPNLGLVLFRRETSGSPDRIDASKLQG